MASKYLDRMSNLVNEKTFSRKVNYIDFNLNKYLSRFTSSKVSVLEIGPGLGELVYYLNLRKIYDIDIIDNDKSILEYVKTKFKIRSDYLLTNIVKQQHRLKKYDLIVMIQVLEHISKLDQSQMLKSLFSHLNVNGYLIIVVPNSNNPMGIVERYGDFQHTISFTQQSFSDMVSNAELKNYNLEIKGYHIPPYDIINIIRVILQKLLHLVLLSILIINGGVFFKTMTPNLMAVIKKEN